MLHLVSIFFSVLVLSLGVPAAPGSPESSSSFEESFRTGVEKYKAKQFEEAKSAFTSALNFNDENPSVLTNLALTYYQLGQKGWALALLRKASVVDPDFSTPQAAMQFIFPQMEVKEIPHEIKFWETFRSAVLKSVSADTFFLFAGVLLLLGGWWILRHMGQRRRAEKDEQRPPPFPLPGVLALLLCFACFSCGILSWYDHQISRATVVVDKAPVLSLPEEKSVSLFEVYAGLEVVIENVKDSWVQITYPGGATGWVPKEILYPTWGKKPW